MLWMLYHNNMQYLKKPNPTVQYIAVMIERMEEFLEMTSGKFASVTELQVMSNFQQNISWAIPSIPVIKIIGRFLGSSNVVEVGAGTGAWAFLLQQICGTNITPTDIPSQYNDNMRKKTFCEINPDGTPDIVTRLNPEALFCCWPPYRNSFAYDCLKNFTGNKFVYIGEPPDGCTADDKFFELLENEWTCEIGPMPSDLKQMLSVEHPKYRCSFSHHIPNGFIEIPNWKGMNDAVYLYVRKNRQISIPKKKRSYRDILLGNH